MSPDYEVDDQVRLARRVGRIVISVLLLGLVLSMAWKIAQVSELRAMHATREHLAASLNGLVAEHVAQNRRLDPAWSKGNPFVLLRWQQDNYCGELAAGDTPRNGCWYWHPVQAWVVYQVRFSDGWPLAPGEMHAYRLAVFTDGASTGAHWTQPVLALELEAVPAAELSAWSWLSN